MRRHRRHISLSLSLSTPDLAGKKPSPGAKNGAPDHLLAGSHRALGCGVHRSRSVRGLFERRCPFPIGVVAFEETPSCAPTRVGVVSSAGRRGCHPRPRRSPNFNLGCPPYRPGRAFKGALAVGPSPVWFPGRRGPDPDRGARPSCNPSGARRRSSSFSSVQGGEGQAGQGRSERSVQRTRAIEDAEMRRPSSSWGGGC
jgi:hypothetical protein